MFLGFGRFSATVGDGGGGGGGDAVHTHQPSRASAYLATRKHF